MSSTSLDSPAHRGAGVEVWWARHLLDQHPRLALRIGPLSLWVHAHTGEWRIAWFPGRTARDTTQSAERDFTGEPPAEAPWQRFSFGGPRQSLRIEPVLPDQPLVARPEVPFTILAGSEITVYVSSPLWVALHHGDDLLPMVEIPTMRLPNTWFGGPTTPGGQAYALRTRARLELSEDAFHPTRVLSSVLIRNRARSHLHLERLRLPMRELSLHYSQRQGFWTNSVTIERRAVDETLVDVRFERGAPFDDLVEIQSPRDNNERHVLQRALDALLS